MQGICNKFIEVNFCVGCFKSEHLPNIDKIVIIVGLHRKYLQYSLCLCINHLYLISFQPILDIPVVVGIPLVSVMKEEDGGLCEVKDVETRTAPMSQKFSILSKCNFFLFFHL